MALLQPSISFADPDVEATISAGFLQGTIGDVVADQLATPDAEFALLGVDSWRVNDTTARFSITVMVLGLAIPMALAADIAVECDESGLSMQIGNATASPFIPIDAAMLDELIRDAQAMLDARVDDIVDPLWDALAELNVEANARGICPHVEVQPDGAIHAEVDFAQGCMNGDTRRTGCGSAGTGFAHSLCINGRWVLQDFGCH